MKTKVCRDCGEESGESNFYSGSAKCKPCYKARVKAHRDSNKEHYREYDKMRAGLPHRVEARAQYQKSEAGKASQNRAKKRWLDANSTKRAANIILGNAVRDGKLEKPEECSECHEKTKLHGHHDDYARPLEVRWLCAPCHYAWHGKHGEGKNGV